MRASRSFCTFNDLLPVTAGKALDYTAGKMRTSCRRAVIEDEHDMLLAITRAGFDVDVPR